jgi:TPR repeat protein
MSQEEIRLPREYDIGDFVEQNLAEASRYPVNLFSAYGVNCNSSDHIAGWKIRAAEGLTESAAQLGLAYLDGNGVVADLEKAKRWLTVAADQGHAFARYKLAAIGFEDCRSGESALDQDGVALFNTLHACARQGVGEACVSLHFILKDHGPLLRMLGADTASAQALVQIFIETLSLCYRHREADSTDLIIIGLRKLGDHGSGKAYQLAGHLLTEAGREGEALESYLLGAKQCRHPRCLSLALKLSDAPEPLWAWAAEHLPVAQVRCHETMKALQVMFESGRGSDPAVTRRIADTLSAYLQEERFLEGRSFIQCLFDLGLWKTSLEHQRIMGDFILRLRTLCPSLAVTEFSHARLEHAFQEIRDAVDAKCAEKGQPALTTSTEAIGSLIGKPDEYMAMTPEQLTRNEFCQIEEFGQLIRGVMNGVGDSGSVLSVWTWNQMFGTKRTHYQDFLSTPNRLVILSYGFARMSEILSRKRAPMRDVFEANISQEIRESIDQHCEKDLGRHSTDASGIYQSFGRGYRQSFRLLADLQACRTDSSADFRPWSVLPPKRATADPIARLNDAPLLSRCPLEKDWLLPNPDFRAFPNDHVALSELINTGDYEGARHRYCSAMYAELMNLGKGLRVEVVHPLAHETLSLMAREMILKGDCASAEPLVDYLLYARVSLKPRGSLWHLSAWIKYRQGKLDDALNALEDTLADCPKDTLADPDYDADIFELKLFHAELMLRDQRLAQARTAHQQLATLCAQAGRSDHRLRELRNQIEAITKETKIQYTETTPDDTSSLSRSFFDVDLEIKPSTLMCKHTDLAAYLRRDRDYGEYVAEFTRLPLSNMDRYRGLFPASK